MPPSSVILRNEVTKNLVLHSQKGKNKILHFVQDNKQRVSG